MRAHSNEPALDPLAWLGAAVLMLALALCGCGDRGPECVKACGELDRRAPLTPADLTGCVEACAMASCVVGCEAPMRAR